ncbi:MAG: hypothetical protein ACRDLL_02665 [Solirubrobacterales bacterium]
MAALAAGIALGSSSAKPHYVRVAEGQIRAQTWSFAIGGHKGKRCYKESLRSRNSNGWTSVCFSDKRPQSNWYPISGIGDAGAVVFPSVTKKRVHSVRLQIGHPRSNGSHWLRLDTHRMNFAQARRAHVKRNFRFVVLTSHRNICVLKVVMFDGSGSKIRTLTYRGCIAHKSKRAQAVSSIRARERAGTATIGRSHTA